MQAIPDNNSGGVTSTLGVSANACPASIQDLNVYLKVNHTWVGDLLATIEHGGTTVTLIDRPGLPALTFGCPWDNVDATFDDAAAAPTAEDSCFVLPSAAIPGARSPNQALSAFNTQNASGTWTLTIGDNAAADTGSLVDWGLDVLCPQGPAATATPTSTSVPTATPTPTATPMTGPTSTPTSTATPTMTSTAGPTPAPTSTLAPLPSSTQEIPTLSNRGMLGLLLGILVAGLLALLRSRPSGQDPSG